MANLCEGKGVVQAKICLYFLLSYINFTLPRLHIQYSVNNKTGKQGLIFASYHNVPSFFLKTINVMAAEFTHLLPLYMLHDTWIFSRGACQGTYQTLPDFLIRLSHFSGYLFTSICFSPQAASFHVSEQKKKTSRLPSFSPVII